MAGAKLDSPFKALESFPGETSGGGKYGDNPNLPESQDGNPKFLFFEEVKSQPDVDIDSPMSAALGKLAPNKAGKDPEGGEVYRKAPLDSPFTPLKK
jgi:hypothetical protein